MRPGSIPIGILLSLVTACLSEAGEPPRLDAPIDLSFFVGPKGIEVDTGSRTVVTSMEEVAPLVEKACTGVPLGRILLRYDETIPLGELGRLLGILARFDFRDLVVEHPLAFIAKVEAKAADYEREKSVSFSLQGHFFRSYEKEYGKDALLALWMELNEACKRKQSWMAVNLMVNLPTLDNAKGKFTFFGVKPEGYFLEERALQWLMEFVLSYPLENPAFTSDVLDNFVRLCDLRTLEFLARVLEYEKLPISAKRGAVRAMLRLLDYDDLMSGKMDGVMVPFFKPDSPQSVKEFWEAATNLKKTWLERRKDYPVQLLPIEFAEKRLDEAKKKAFEYLESKGFDMTGKAISADPENLAWKKHLSGMKKIEAGDIIRKLSLKEGRYLAIYVGPAEPKVLGGDAWVFVDIVSGEVIDVLIGQ